MRVIALPKGAGKTTELIKISQETGAYIVCHSQDEASRISFVATGMGAKIPFPLTYAEFIQHQYHAPGVRTVVVDNADWLVRYISRVPVAAITITTDTIEDLLGHASDEVKELYNTSAQFNAALNVLSQGADKVSIVANLCLDNLRLQKQLTRYVEKYGTLPE